MGDPKAVVLRTFARNIAITVAIAAVTLYAIHELFLVLGYEITDLNAELILAGWILLIGYLVDRSFSNLARGWVRAQDGHARLAAVSLLVDLAIVLLVVLALFALFNVSVTALFLGSAFGGLIIGLAGQTLLANIFAGITLTFSSPYRVGDRVSLISSSYGAMAPSYPHEMTYPSYTGVVQDTGLIYTVLSLDGGRVAKVPNSVVIQALLINHTDGMRRIVRVRVTLPYTVPIELFDRAVDVLRPQFPVPPSTEPMNAKVIDLQPTSWDGLIELWSADPEEIVRDRILRGLAAQLPLASLVPPVPPGGTVPPAPAPEGPKRRAGGSGRSGDAPA